MRGGNTTRKTTIELLARVPLLNGLPKRTLEGLAEAGRLEDVDGGTLLTHEGEAAGRFYLIIEGEAEVLVGSEVVAKVGAGAHVGELSLLDRRPQTATVRALTPLRLFSLAPWHARPYLQDPVVLERLLVTVCGWLRDRMAPAELPGDLDS